jgi:hypothetical protein
MEFRVVRALVQIALKVDYTPLVMHCHADYIPLVMHCHYAHMDVTAIIPMHASNQNV